MDLKAFYYDVRIEATALVYAKTQEEADQLMKLPGITIAGNSARNATIEVLSQARQTVS